MVYKRKIQVIDIKVDEPLNDIKFVQISLGFKLDSDKRGAPPIFKHSIHIFIPKEEWRSQYKMWEEYTLSIDDSGNIIMKKLGDGD